MHGSNNFIKNLSCLPDNMEKEQDENPDGKKDDVTASKEGDGSRPDKGRPDDSGSGFAKIKNMFRKMSAEEAETPPEEDAESSAGKSSGPDEGPVEEDGLKEHAEQEKSDKHEGEAEEASGQEKGADAAEKKEGGSIDAARTISGIRDAFKEKKSKEPKKETPDKPEDINEKEKSDSVQEKTEEKKTGKKEEDKPKKSSDRMGAGKAVSGIKGVLKGKKAEKPEKKTADKAGHKKDQDGWIDIGKTISGIKGVLKGDSGKGKGEDNGSSDFRLMLKFLVALFVVAGLAGSIYLGTEIRMQAGNLGFAYIQAGNYVDRWVVEDISRSLDQEYPNLPERNKELLILERLENISETEEYAQSVEEIAYQYRSFFQDDRGRNYMPDIDSYYWWIYARNVDETGNVGDEIRDGVQWDSLQVAPTGRPIQQQDTFYPTSIVLFHKSAKAVGKLPFFREVVGDTDLIRVLMFYPVFISALTIALVFMLTRRIAGNIAAFFAAIMVGVHPVLLRRTMFGHADSDAIVVFFSVLVLWLFIEAFTARKVVWRVIFAGLAGIASGLYSLTWGGWWWIFDFVMAASTGTLAAFIIYDTVNRTLHREGSVFKNFFSSIRDKTSIRAITAIGVYFFVTGIFVSAFFGIRNFVLTPLTSLGFTTIKAPVTGAASPNVLRTVAELNEGTVGQAINQIGVSLFWVAVFGITFIAIKAIFIAARGIVHRLEKYGTGRGPVKTMVSTSIKATVHAFKKDDKTGIINNIFYAAVLTMWVAATLYSVTKGIRFTLLIVPAFSIAFGAFFGLIAHFSNWFARFLEEETEFDKGVRFIVVPLMFLVLIMIFFAPFTIPVLAEVTGANLRNDFEYVWNAAEAVPANDGPIMNDAWHNALTSIKDNSEENAIITSWWDFGHHFKAIAERPVTFDGATQSTPQAHWVGRFFMTDNETEAIGILRMLDCGGSQATDRIAEGLDRIQDNSDGNHEDQTVEAVKLTKQIILLGREDAENALTDRGFSATEADQILGLTHCDPPEAFVIASDDMIGKAGVWGHFGGWNYTKADLWKSARELPRHRALQYMKEKHGIEEDEANVLFLEMQGIADDQQADAWISPWPRIAGTTQACRKEGELVSCENGLVVNVTAIDAWFTTQNGNLHPQSIVYLNESEFVEKRYNVNTIPEDLSVLLIPEGDGFSSLVASPELANSIFVRMFFLNGHGLKHFRLLTTEDGTEIWVWQADWEGKQENLLPGLKEKTEVSSGDKVSMIYVGYLENGTVFDSSIIDFTTKDVTKETPLDDSHQHKRLEFTLGTNTFIPPGFEKGVLGAKIGEEKTFTISPEEGYTTDPNDNLFNKSLIFRIKVIGIT